MSEADEWAGLPAVGTKVRVPYPKQDAEGEVVLHHRIFGRAVARVRVQLPKSHQPYETHGVNMTFDPDGMEILSE